MKTPTKKSSVQEVVAWLKEARLQMKAQGKEFHRVINQQAVEESYQKVHKLEMKLSDIQYANEKLVVKYEKVLRQNIDRILEAV